MNKESISFLSKIILQNDPCCMGCDGYDIPIMSASDLLNGLPGKYQIVECSSCGLKRTNPWLTLSKLNTHYPDNYGPYVGSIINSIAKKPNIITEFIKKYVKIIFKFNDVILPTATVGNMLEVGCASGSFMHQMAEKGWSVHGIEVSMKAALATREFGYSVHAGSLESAPLPKKSYDLIVAWMVIEHFHDPLYALKKLREWSNSSTCLVFSVPNAGSFEFLLFKQKWFALQVPTHMYHFTPKTINKLLEEAGWKTEKIFYQRTLTNFIASLGYILQDKGFVFIGEKLINFPSKGKRWMHYTLYPISLLISVFHQSSNITIWAKPISNNS